MGHDRVRAVAGVVCVSVAFMFLVVLAVRIDAVVDRRGDEAAWRELLEYAREVGPPIRGDVFEDPPCTFDPEAEYDLGNAHIEAAEKVDNVYGLDARGRVAAETLKATGWRRGDRETAATITFFTGTRTFAGRRAFVAVEADSAEDLETSAGLFGIRYNLEAEAC